MKSHISSSNTQYSRGTIIKAMLQISRKASTEVSTWTIYKYIQASDQTCLILKH